MLLSTGNKDKQLATLAWASQSTASNKRKRTSAGNFFWTSFFKVLSVFVFVAFSFYDYVTLLNILCKDDYIV